MNDSDDEIGSAEEVDEVPELEATDEVVERLRKEKDELMKIALHLEKRKNRYKQKLQIEKESHKRTKIKFAKLHLEIKVRKFFILHRLNILL